MTTETDVRDNLAREFRLLAETDGRVQRKTLAGAFVALGVTDLAGVQTTPAPKGLRDFNGLRESAISRRQEWGIFRERHASSDRLWSIRARPIGENGEVIGGWGLPQWYGRTLRDARRALGKLIG